MVRLTSLQTNPDWKQNQNVLRYWEQFKESKRELHKLSQVVLAVPATQISVEKAILALKYVLSPLRRTCRNNFWKIYF